MMGVPPLSDPVNSRNVCPKELDPMPMNRPSPSNTGSPGPDTSCCAIAVRWGRDWMSATWLLRM